MSAKELTFSEPVELTDAETDAVTGGCVIGPAGQTALQTQLSFFGTDPVPVSLDTFQTANTKTGGCFSL